MWAYVALPACLLALGADVRSPQVPELIATTFYVLSRHISSSSQPCTFHQSIPFGSKASPQQTAKRAAYGFCSMRSKKSQRRRLLSREDAKLDSTRKCPWIYLPRKRLGGLDLSSERRRRLRASLSCKKDTHQHSHQREEEETHQGRTGSGA